MKLNEKIKNKTSSKHSFCKCLRDFLLHIIIVHRSTVVNKRNDLIYLNARFNGGKSETFITE